MNRDLIDRNELNVPSDENDYDELVQFADDVMNASTVPAILIPEHATNGDMIKAVFGAEDIDEDFMMQIITVTMRDARKTFGRDWWYAPYKKEVEE